MIIAISEVESANDPNFKHSRTRTNTSERAQTNMGAQSTFVSLAQGAFNRRAQVWVQIIDLCVSVAGLLLAEAGGAYPCDKMK